MKNHTVYDKGRRSETITVADLAKLVRTALAKAFPAVDFTVKSETASRVREVAVYWRGGPSDAEVQTVVNPYATKWHDFDKGRDMDRVLRINNDGSILEYGLILKADAITVSTTRREELVNA